MFTEQVLKVFHAQNNWIYWFGDYMHVHPCTIRAHVIVMLNGEGGEEVREERICSDDRKYKSNYTQGNKLSKNSNQFNSRWASNAAVNTLFEASKYCQNHHFLHCIRSNFDTIQSASVFLHFGSTDTVMLYLLAIITVRDKEPFASRSVGLWQFIMCA